MVFSFVATILLVWIASANAFEENLPRSVSPIAYNDVNDAQVSLLGYMVLPPSLALIKIDTFYNDNSTDDDFDDSGSGFPAVIILPDSNNINGYEISRATRIAGQLGCIAFVADIYGSDLHDVQDFQQRTKLANNYKANHTSFRSRIESAIVTLGKQPYVNPSKIALVGYGLGGTGALLYSFAGSNSNAIAAVSFHGELLGRPLTGAATNPILVLSGSQDDAGFDVEVLEESLVASGVDWQITRYSGIRHDFTVYGSVTYSEWVDQRSWNEMATFLEECFGQSQYGALDFLEDDDGEVDDGNTTTIIYSDSNGNELGSISLPESENSSNEFPAALILPHSDGSLEYETELAQWLTEQGYATVLIDLFGQNPSGLGWFKQIDIAIDNLREAQAVSEIFLIGNGVGGIVAVEYVAQTNASQTIEAVVLIADESIRLPVMSIEKASFPYVLTLSAGVDAYPSYFESILDETNANWEISRSSSMDPILDSHSQQSMLSLFESIRGGAEYSDSRTKDDVDSDTIKIIEVEVEGPAPNTTIDSSSDGNHVRCNLSTFSAVLLMSILF